MKKQLLTVLILCFCVSLCYSQDTASKFIKVKELDGIEEYRYLQNDMSVLLFRDSAAPVVTVQIVYNVGSKNEVSGNTGSAHLLEHLNFKGTPTFNKANGNAIFNVLQGIGARMNATTWYDRTNYYETIPSDKIELALHIESDRMRNSLLLREDKDAEMTVVRNEFERGENNPSALLSKEMWATAYMAHPYHHNTIGWRSDIENIPIEVLQDFYNTYYWPNNATLTIIGDFEKQNVFNLIDKYFGKISKAPHAILEPYTEEPDQLGPRRVIIKKPGQQSLVSIGYKIPGRMHEDLPALQVLGEIMGSGTSSVLSKTFIDTGIALYGSARPSDFKELGLFSVTLGFSPNKNHHEINNQLLEVIEKVKLEGVMQDDVDRIVAKLNAQSILSRDGSAVISSQLNEAIAAGDWTDYINGIKRLSSITPADVIRVANTYLVEDQSTTGYLISKELGNKKQTENEASNFLMEDDGALHFRTLNRDAEKDIVNPSALLETMSIYDSSTLNNTSDKFKRSTVANIDVVTAKTAAKDFINVIASFPIGSYFNTNGNNQAPSITTQMLSKGTTKNDKFQISQKLEKLGVNLRVSARKDDVFINFKCLSKDLQMVIDLLAEELRYPSFDSEEFKLLVQQNINNLKQQLTNPDTQASIALSNAIYPQNHLNYLTDIETSIKELESLTLDEVKSFHQVYFGTKGMRLVAVGDVDSNNLYQALNNVFGDWNSGIDTPILVSKPLVSLSPLTKVITIPNKPSATLLIGQYTGLMKRDNDYLPFYIGTSILGGGFSGRLMQTVRDRDGLTYSISASNSTHPNAGGNFSIKASFNPKLFQKGLKATMEEITKWVNEGVTEEELAIKKANLTGSFKVGLSTTSGLASTILSFIEIGLEPSYIDQYSHDVEAVTLEQVNAAIKRYINLDKLIIIKSGSLDENSEPLN